MLFQLVLTKFFKSELFSCLLDCERSLFFFKFSEGSAHADERWVAKPRDARNEGGIPRRKKKNRETARSLTLRSRFTCLACQHFSFHAKKSLDRERPFSLALRVVYLFSCLSRLAPSVTRVVICVSRAFCSTDQEKRETARSLRVYRKLITWPTKAKRPILCPRILQRRYNFMSWHCRGVYKAEYSQKSAIIQTSSNHRSISAFEFS